MSDQLSLNLDNPNAGFLSGLVSRFGRVLSRRPNLPALLLDRVPVDRVPDTEADATDAEAIDADFSPLAFEPVEAPRALPAAPAAAPAPVSVAWFRKGSTWHLRASPKGRPFATVSKVTEGKHAGEYRVVIKDGSDRPAWDYARHVPQAKRLANDWYAMNRPHVSLR